LRVEVVQPVSMVMGIEHVRTLVAVVESRGQVEEERGSG
jgi:hypothetical protein